MDFSGRSGEMEIFAKVAQEGSLSAAARALGLTPSAVSRILARTEQRLGTRLLLRTTRAITLTPEGEAYLRGARRVLADMLEVPVIPTRNLDERPFGNPLCTASLPLMDKFSRITRSVQSAAAHAPLPVCTPVCGFWGVPPRDFSLLAPFPDTTHVFGWTRCMENKTPADLDLERQFDPDIPTVFFAQSFCAKSALAQHLAGKHPRALAIDCDVTPGSSTRAKIEAFLELSGIEPARRSPA